MSLRRVLAIALVGASALACDVFDEQLEKRLEAAEPEPDAGGGGVTDAGLPLLELENVCSTSLPRVESDVVPRVIPITALTSNVREAGGCALTREVLGGADGFFEIRATAGERWHFHLDAAEGQNLAVAASRTCDIRECIASSDVCGTGESEHFTFIPETTGTYVVMVEGIDTTRKEPLSLLAINPVCGDGVKEHSEVCDDGNVRRNDGCDDVCRVELRDNESEEVEPNDDTYGANVLMPPRLDRPVNVRGKVAGGACQPDYYMLRVDQRSTLAARVLAGSGDACSDAPPMELSLRGSDREELREKGVLTSVSANDGACPAIEGRVVSPGTYFLRLRHLEPADQFEYILSIEVTPEA